MIIYAVMQNEYGFVVWNERSKMFFDKTKAMNYLFEMLHDTKLEKFAMPRQVEEQAYKIIEVEVI